MTGTVISKATDLVGREFPLTLLADAYVNGTYLQLELDGCVHAYNGRQIRNPHYRISNKRYQYKYEGQQETATIVTARIERQFDRKIKSYASVEDYYKDSATHAAYIRFVGDNAISYPYPSLVVGIEYMGKVYEANRALEECQVPEPWYTKVVSAHGRLTVTKGFHLSPREIDIPKHNLGLHKLLPERVRPLFVFPAEINTDKLDDVLVGVDSRTPYMRYNERLFLGLDLPVEIAAKVIEDCFRIGGKVVKDRPYNWKHLY